MAAPNLVSVSSIYGKTLGQELPATANTGIVTCAADKCLKINSIIVASIDGSNAGVVTCNFYDSSMSRRNPIASDVTVPANSTLIVLGKDAPIYLEESDEIEAHANLASKLQITVSYEELDDA